MNYDACDCIIVSGDLDRARALLDANEERPLILISPDASADAIIDALNAGVTDYLGGDPESESLVAAVDRVLERQQLADALNRAETPLDTSGTKLLGESAQIIAVRDLVGRAAATDATVLICGETGSGKDVLARAVHDQSTRASHRFIAVNCSAIPSELFESEFFGHMRGAFTDARRSRDGILAAAEGGTLFLDEVDALELTNQVKLLRVLQERKFRPLGGGKEVDSDIRVIAATNRNIEKAVADGAFREDLFYRLDVIRLAVPPLRARRGDILPLANYFLRVHAKTAGKAVSGVTPAAAQRLLTYSWPGNVRELENCMEAALGVAKFDRVMARDLPSWVCNTETGPPGSEPPESIEERERRQIVRVMRMVGGNKTRAAELLAIDRKTLYRKMEKFALDATTWE